MTNPSDFSLAQAADPSTPAALLGEIATHRPDLRAAVASNPTAYPALLDWLRAFGDPAIDAALAARGGAAPVAQGALGPHDQVDPTATQPLPTGSDAYDITPTTYGINPTGQPGPGAADPWGPPASAAPAGRWSAPGQATAWTPQGTGAENAWGSSPVAGPTAAWGQQPAADQHAAWAQSQPTGKKSRRGLWIGLGVAGVLVVVGAAFAANALWFSKVGGAKTPEAAVTQMVDAVVAKDLVGVYGVTSPAELDNASTALTLFTDRMSENTDLDTGALVDVYKDYFEAFDFTVDGLEVEVEEIEDGLAKVTIVAGQLTIDADTDMLVDTTVSAMSELENGPLAEFFDLAGEPLPSEAEIRDEIETQVMADFPVDVSAADMDPGAFLMVVREGDSWYVSPTLTVLEYGALTEGVERGSLPSDDLAGQFDTPEAAADGMVTGLKDYLTTGDTDALLKPLPLADRRALSLYGAFDDVDVAELSELQELLENSEIDASFTVQEEDDGVAWLQLENLTFSGEVDGASGTVDIVGECLTADINGQTVEACLDDVPALKELGLGDLSLIAVEEDGSWYITYAGTAGDSSGILLSNVLRLYDEGKLLDIQWWMDNLGVLADQLY